MHCSKFNTLIEAVSYHEQKFKRHQQIFDATRGQEEAASGDTSKGAQRLRGQLAKVYETVRPSTGPTPEQIRAALTKKP